MAAVCAPEFPVEVAYASDSADEGDFWNELGSDAGTQTGQMGFASRRASMGPHCVWSNDSSTDMEALRLDFPDSFPPESAEDDMHDTTPEVPIPCMAQLLEKEIKANEEAPVTPCRGPRSLCMGLPVAMSCSDLNSLGCLAVRGMIPSQPAPLSRPAKEPVALVPADAKVVESQPQLNPPQLRSRQLQPGVSVCHPAVRGVERRPSVALTAWRGCQKNPWCNRESRHRGVCNARAAAPGFTLHQEAVSFETSPNEELGSVTEEPSHDNNDSEQASATEVKSEGSADAPQSARRKGPLQEFPGVIVPVTPAVAPPCMPSQESLESCRSADSNLPREEEVREASEFCSPRIPPAVVQSMPASHFAAAAAPGTPRTGAAYWGTKRGINAIAAPAASVMLVPPVQEAGGDYWPEALEVQVPQVAPGCVQLSSGRIARPTSKTAPSRTSSAELSENFPSDDGRATSGKRKGGRQSKSAEKAAKRRRMVGGVLKTVGTAAPGQQCTQCGTQVTPVWRAGPYGPKTLCNACGVRYMKQVKKK